MGFQLNPLHSRELRKRAGRVCMALAGPAMVQPARHARTSTFLEFRLDSVPEPSALIPQVREFLAERSDITAIATCRRGAHGGGFHGSAASQVELLVRAVQAGCLLADIEIETAEELGPAALDQLRAAGAAVILSWHDFSATPDLQAVLKRLQGFNPDFLKIVPTARSVRDALQVIDLLEQHGSGGRLIAMSMGQKGVLTRVLGPRFGSAFTFAAPDGAEGTASGQIALTTLRDLYRIDSITARTDLYAVAGSPIGASLSPLMHNTAFAATGFDAVYVPLETADAEELREVIQRLGVRGVSITMPLKETVIPLLSHRDTTVQRMGACNTLLRQTDGSLAGFNTDMHGITGPLRRRLALQGKRALVLGAGGAARAAVFGLRDAGAEVLLLNRTAERAEALGHEAGAHVQPRHTLHETHFDIIINSTPCGMRGEQMEAPITPNEMNCGTFFDLVYNPVETPLLRMAEGKGIATIPGVEMFVAQGEEQFRIWTNQPAPKREMSQAVRQALHQQA